MPSNHKLSIPPRNAACDGIVDRLDAGRIEIRTGPPPTNPTDASSGNLLATCTFGTPAYGSAANGTATANAITPGTAVDSGDAGYFRVYASGAGDTACESQGTAGEAADTPDMTFDNKSIVSGGSVAITSFTTTVPEQ